MGRFMLGVLTTIILLTCVALVLFTFDKVEVIDLQKGALLVLGRIPGWEKLPDELTAGREQLNSWEEKEKTYQEQIDQLKKSSGKLQQERDQALAKVAASAKTTAPEKREKQEAAVTEQKQAMEEQTARLIGEMKPKAAADYLIRVPPPLALDILRKLEPRKAAKIMEAMPTEDGSALISMMAETP